MVLVRQMNLSTQCPSYTHTVAAVDNVPLVMGDDLPDYVVVAGDNEGPVCVRLPCPCHLKKRGSVSGVIINLASRARRLPHSAVYAITTVQQGCNHHLASCTPPPPPPSKKEGAQLASLLISSCAIPPSPFFHPRQRDLTTMAQTWNILAYLCLFSL